MFPFLMQTLEITVSGANHFTDLMSQFLQDVVSSTGSRLYLLAPPLRSIAHSNTSHIFTIEHFFHSGSTYLLYVQFMA